MFYKIPSRFIDQYHEVCEPRGICREILVCANHPSAWSEGMFSLCSMPVIVFLLNGLDYAEQLHVQQQCCSSYGHFWVILEEATLVHWQFHETYFGIYESPVFLEGRFLTLCLNYFEVSLSLN